MSDNQMYTYRHQHPAVTVDIVVFSLSGSDLSVLLVQRAVEPYKGSWALPGGFVGIGEDLKAAATRELAEETGVREAFLEQLGAFGAPDRDPRERVISIGFWSTLPHEKLELKAGSDASATKLFPISTLPDLAFDHEEILRAAHAHLIDKLRTSTLALEFLPEEFTLAELQSVHESILGQSVDKRNFRKWAKDLGFIKPTGKKRRGGQHRPAEIFRADRTGDNNSVVDLDTVLPVKPKTAVSASSQDYQQGYDKGYRAGAENVHKLFTSAYRATVERD